MSSLFSSIAQSPLESLSLSECTTNYIILQYLSILTLDKHIKLIYYNYEG